MTFIPILSSNFKSFLFHCLEIIFSNLLKQEKVSTKLEDTSSYYEVIHCSETRGLVRLFLSLLTLLYCRLPQLDVPN